MTEILLKNIGKKLSARPLAATVFSKIQDGAEVGINFNGVESVTPSFCHEMLLILKKKKIKARFINADENIQFQIRKAISSL